MTDLNGHGPADAQAASIADAVYANYGHFAQRLAAIGLLLGDLPLEHMLAAVRRHQRTSVLTLPAGTDPQQAIAQQAALRMDEKLITAAVNLQRVRACPDRRPGMTDPMPVFVIKAKDSLAMSAVEAYRILCRHSGMPGQADQVQLALDEIEAWQGRNPELVKPPYHRHMPAGPATQTPPAAGLTADQADALIEFARQFWANLREAFAPILAALKPAPSPHASAFDTLVESGQTFSVTRDGVRITGSPQPAGPFREQFWTTEYHRLRRQQGRLLDKIASQQTSLDVQRQTIEDLTAALQNSPASLPGSTQAAQQDDNAATHTDNAKPPTATTAGPTPTRANVLNLAADQLDQIAFARCAAPGTVDHEACQWTAEGISYAAAKLRDWAQNLPPTVVQTFAGP